MRQSSDTLDGELIRAKPSKWILQWMFVCFLLGCILGVLSNLFNFWYCEPSFYDHLDGVPRHQYIGPVLFRGGAYGGILALICSGVFAFVAALKHYKVWLPKLYVHLGSSMGIVIVCWLIGGLSLLSWAHNSYEVRQWGTWLHAYYPHAKFYVNYIDFAWVFGSSVGGVLAAIPASLYLFLRTILDQNSKG